MENWIRLIVLAVIIIAFLAVFLYNCKVCNNQEQEVKLRIDGKYFYSDDEAMKYYQGEVFKCRRSVMVDIFDYETNEIITRKKCSEYFSTKTFDNAR